MEDFFSDKEKPASSEVNLSNETPKKESNPFKLEVNKKEGTYIPSEQYRFESPLTPKEREKVGSYYLSQDPTKILSKSQSTLEQFANMGGHIVTNFVGDTISSVGSTFQIGADIINEVKDKDAEFTNDVIEFGNNIKEWGKTNLKTYRENPNESWDMSDPAWWTDGIESAFSSLSFLVGGIGAVKGVGALAKLTRAEKLLASAGANVEKLKLGTKIATSATFARNAENMMESYSVRQDTKNNLLKEWEENPDKFNEIANSEVGDELRQENRTVDKETLANFIAGKAGWKTYAINSLNIAFDALQMTPLFKGFNPSTSISKFATSSKVKEANAKLLNANARSASKLDKVFDVLNPAISGIGRSASEGLEEAINYIGTEEGKNLADQLTKKDDSSFSTRMAKYLKSGDLYESAFWGVAGGAMFEGATHITNKLSKGISSNSSTDLRLAEINNRIGILKDGSDAIKKVTLDETLNDNDKKAQINNIKSELSLDLGLRAAQAGNIDLLIEQIGSKEYKQKLIDDGISEEIDVDKTIAKTISDVKLAEKLYKNHYNSFQTAEGSELVKNSLINKSVVTDFFIQKNQERINTTNLELQELKNNDQYIKNSDNRNLESLIYLHSLQAAKESINEYISNAKEAKDELLSIKGKTELEKINTKIKELKEQVGEDTLSLRDINPAILTKQTEIILMEGVNNIQHAKTIEYRQPENIKKQEEIIKQKQQEFQEDVFSAFKDEINDGVEKETITSASIEKLIKENKKDKKKVDFLNTILADLKTKEEVSKRKTEVDEALNTPVNNAEVDEFGDLPQFENIELTAPVSPIWKSGLDQHIDTRNIDELRALLVDNDALASTNPNEVQYVKNRIQEIRNNKKKQSEIQQLNTSLPNTKVEFEFNEDNVQNEKPKVTLENLDAKITEEGVNENPNNLTFLSKEVATGSIRTYLPIFGYGLAHSDKIENFYKIVKGNIVVKDEYVDLIKALMNPDLTDGVEVEIIWDKDNEFTREEWKNNINNEAFKIVYKGTTLSYLPTEATTLKEIKAYKDGRKGLDKAERDYMIKKLQLELPHTLALRKQLELSDKTFKTKILKKGNGTVVSRGLNKNNLHSVKGIYEDFFALAPDDLLNYTKLLNISNTEESFSASNPLVRYVDGVPVANQGKIYGKQIDANGKPFPVPLSISKVNLVQAKELQGNIEELLTLLNEGKHTENDEVKAIKDKISKYIKIDRSANYDKPIGFRVFPQGTNKEGEKTEARIEMSYFNHKGEKLIAVIRISTSGAGSYVGVFGNGKKLHETTIDNKDFVEILQRKYHNIDFHLLQGKEKFSYNGKTYPTYKDYLIEEEIIQTDVAQVTDKKGNVLSNLFGADNDFTLSISPVLNNESVDTTFKSKGYEAEMKVSDTVDNNVEYRKDYKLYSDNKISAKDMLSDILKNPLNSNIKELATYLQSHISKTDVQIALGKIVNEDSASYSTSSNIITLNSSRNFSEVYLQQTVLHEMLHALTVNGILNSLELSQEVIDKLTKLDYIDITDIPFKKNTPEYVKKFVTEIIVLRNNTISQLTKKYGKSLEELTAKTSIFYGLENSFEFISEAMTNPNFRNELRTLKNGSNILTDLYNKIIEFLNNLLKTNLSKIERTNLENAVNLIKNFIDNIDEIKEAKFDTVAASKTVDKFDNHFTTAEIFETINTFEGMILNVIRNNKIDTQTGFNNIDNNRDTRIQIRKQFEDYLTNCPESVKNKTTQVVYNFDNFYEEAFKRIKKNFKIASSFDIEELQDNQEVTKDWNDKAAQQVSSQDSITNQIKMFIKTIPQLDSTEVTFDENNNPIWDRKKSTMTGLSTYIDFNAIYPYMIRNLIGAKSMSDIIDRLEHMSKINPSFSYIAYQLKSDANLLAQFESNLAKKYIYDSYVTFIKNIEGNKEIWVTNELKTTQYDQIIANEWNLKINSIIDSIKEPNDKLEFNKKVNTLNLKITQKAKDFENNKKELVGLFHEFGALVGVDLSMSVIQSRIDTARNFEDLEIYKTFGNIIDTILRAKKNDSFGRLNSLAKLEALVRFDIVENSGLDIKGNLIYAIRNPNYISNWFSNAKSDTKEGREFFEQTLLNMSKIPDLQFSNWLWNSKEQKGFLDYTVVSGKKIPINNGVNWEFVKNFNFHNFGGAKETLTKNSQDYTDFSEKDWQMINLLNYIRPDDKTERTKGKDREFVLLPSLIPSDSGTMYLFNVPKVKLSPADLIKTKNAKGITTNVKINTNSKLFNAILNINRQEIRRIQQATAEIFDIVDNKLVVKKDLDLNNVQQYFHYGKGFVYNEDGTIDLTKTFLKEDGTPIGKAFQFSNMLIEKDGKVLTLNDIEGIKINGHLGLGEISSEVVTKIKNFTEAFINQQINEGIADYRSIETEVADKYSSVSDGTFENLVSEYILNTFIANNEQFNFFNGSITEYKDKIDTNKRAKQMFAPGIGLSLEAMKITYENGNYSTGNTFSAITLKDIKTKSATIDFISKSVKDRLIAERPNTYSKSEIENYSLKGKSQLDKDVFEIIGGYLNINAGDAQGYITLDRYEQILRGLGRFDKSMEQVFEKARKGETLNISEIQALQPLKGFYYGREYDNNLNRLTSNQIKYSSIPLLPQLVNGTELEKLMNYMNANNIEEAFFESAHKVGARNIYKIDNEDGTINEEILKNTKPTTYYNKNWQLQLDVPEHLLDEENLLATQIAKIIIGNLDPNTDYIVGGKSYKADNLIKHYFNTLENNIIESANDLIKELGVEKTDNGFIIKDKDIQKLLIAEVEKRGLSDNYSYAIELNEQGEFKLPLFVNSMATKWEAILTSIFTNRIVRQKVPGGSAVLGSRLFLDNQTSQSDSKIEGIQWSKDKENNKTLKSYKDESGIQVAEVLLSSWNSHMFKEGQRVNIDDLSDEVKTMIGYRIPTDAKHQMIVFKVVGFLPEQNRGLIITPDDLVVQMGSDFDIDKLFLMNKHFYKNDNNEFVVPKLGKEQAEFKSLLKEQSELREALKLEKTEANSEGKLLGDIFGLDLVSPISSEKEQEKLNDRLKEINKRLRQITNFDKETNLTSWKEEGSREARQNEIFDIYHSILTNQVHMKELFTPAEFEDFKNLKIEIETIFNESDANINPLTDKGQRTFRKRNIAGRSLKGIAANLNAFGSVAQVSKMKLNDKLGFKFKFDLDKYDINTLIDRYDSDIEIKDNFAYITFKHLGSAPDGTFLNVDGKLILEHASQGISAAVDIAKDPTFDAFNATTYTYPLFHTMLLAGVPTRLAGMFIRQPIIKQLNDYYFETKSLLGDTSGNQIESVKRYYQTLLYLELEKEGKVKPDKKIQKVLDRRNKDKVTTSFDKKYLIYIDRDTTQDILGYSPDELPSFDVEELKNQLKKQKEIKDTGYSKTSSKEKIDYLVTQLQVLEYFNTWKKAGEGVQDILQATKTDSIGAGPSMDVTSNLIRTINRLRFNDRVEIDGVPAIRHIYPSHFEDEELNKDMDKAREEAMKIAHYNSLSWSSDNESVYKPLENYLNYGNKLSVSILNNLFINQSNSFKDVISTINGLINKNLNEEKLKFVNKFLNVSILQDFEYFQDINKSDILGIEKEIVNEVNNIDEFKVLSTANKVAILKKEQQEFLTQNPQHILNFLTPLLSGDNITENKYHKIDFVFYKNEFTDDALADSITTMYRTGTEFEKDLASSLIKYVFVANGLTFGFQSFAKVLPNEILEEIGLGKYLRKQQTLLNNISIFDYNTIDKFFKNNWNNSLLIPSVKTKWDYLPAETINQIKDNLSKGVSKLDISKYFNISEETIGRIANNKTKVIRTDRENNKRTKDSSPLWNSESNILIISKKSLKTLNDDIVNAPYLTIPTKDGSILYKRYSKSEITDNKEVTKNVFNDSIYYYRVNKLGKDGILEFSDNSMFAENNTDSVENVLITQIENIVQKVEQQRVLDLKNTPKDKQDEIKNNCKYGS